MIVPASGWVWALNALQNSMMLTPCWPSAGPTGGAGVAAPALIWSLMTAVNRFLGGMTSFLVTGWSGPVAGPRREVRAVGGDGVLRLDLLDLVERELDRRLPAEDGDQHLQLLLLGVDLVDRGREGRERAVHDGDRLADLEVDDGGRRGGRGGAGRLRRTGRLRTGRGREQADDLVDAQWRRARRRPDEPGDPGGVAHRAPGLVVEVHADEQVAGQLLPVDLGPLAVLDLGDLLGGHLDLEDVVLHVERLDARLQVGLQDRKSVV